MDEHSQVIIPIPYTELLKKAEKRVGKQFPLPKPPKFPWSLAKDYSHIEATGKTHITKKSEDQIIAYRFDVYAILILIIMSCIFGAGFSIMTIQFIDSTTETLAYSYECLNSPSCSLIKILFQDEYIFIFFRQKIGFLHYSLACLYIYSFFVGGLKRLFYPDLIEVWNYYAGSRVDYLRERTGKVLQAYMKEILADARKELLADEKLPASRTNIRETLDRQKTLLEKVKSKEKTVRVDLQEALSEGKKRLEETIASLESALEKTTTKLAKLETFFADAEAFIMQTNDDFVVQDLLQEIASEVKKGDEIILANETTLAQTVFTLETKVNELRATFKVIQAKSQALQLSAPTTAIESITDYISVMDTSHVPTFEINTPSHSVQTA